MRQFNRRAPLALVTLALAFGLVLPAAGTANGQERQMPELPDTVKTFMERDQVRRWANLIETGGKLYAEGSCTRCHGEGGTSGRSGPDLTDAEWVQSDGSLDGIRETIFWGVRRKDFADPNRRFQMNPGGGMDLEWDDYDALAAYVWSLSNETGLPQR
jgi:mono/diheme cytochrome c family protein